MKELTAILALLFYTATAHAQVVPWVAFPVDAAVMLKVPSKPQLVPDAARFAPKMPASQIRGYRYTDAAGIFIILRLEKPMDKLYATDSNPEFYNQQIDGLMKDMHGTLVEEATLLNGSYQARATRFTVPDKGMYYSGMLVVHGVSYQWQYMPSRPATKDQDAKLWAQLLDSLVSVK